MGRFLAIGECMIELSPRGDGLYAQGFAGDTFNTAWYARRLAPATVEVGYLSAVGDDEPSQRMKDFMRAAGIVPHLAVRPDRTVGLYMISLNRGERSFAYWRGQSAARTLADDLDALPGIGAGDMVLFTGITLAILPAEARARLLSVLAVARSAGARIAFDPNLRPRLWPDAATMCAAVTQAAAVCDIALPSFDDEAAFFADADPEATAARYADAGAGLVAVKDGARPVLLRDAGGLARVTPEPVAQVVDTTAAGDSFNAAFLMALMAGQGAVEAARAGCALSRKVIGAPGALAEV